MLKQIFYSVFVDLIKPPPSKFGKGLSLLWWGNNFSTVINCIFSNSFNKNSQIGSNIFIYESARSSIYSCLVSQGVGNGHEVIISAFTCDAVPYAVLQSCATPVYVDINDDLTMSDQNLLEAITSRTRAVILQNTFGRLGLRLETISYLRKKGIFIIEDCALSVGSKLNNIPLGLFGDVSVWSLEVSKTVTIGWGGVANTNSPSHRVNLEQQYSKLKRISIYSDLKRIFQLLLSVFLTRTNIYIGGFIWYFMYGLRIFRRSNNFSDSYKKNQIKIGKLSEKIFRNISISLEKIFNKTNYNYILLLNEAINLGVSCPIIQKKGEFIVTPRLSILVNEEKIDDVIKYATKNNIEIGRWFSEAPPKYKIEECVVHSYSNAKRISKLIINLPNYWTIKQKDLNKLKEILTYIASLK
jgi:perosamine synthetase